jgi:hypothetical protein
MVALYQLLPHQILISVDIFAFAGKWALLFSEIQSLTVFFGNPSLKNSYYVHFFW